MQTPPTDVVANMLAIRLFLFGLAAMSFFESLKMEKPRSYVGWGAAALFAVSATALTALAAAFPIAAVWLGDLVSSPVTWFVLMMGLFFVLRSRWQPKLAANDLSAIGQEYTESRIASLESKFEAQDVGMRKAIGAALGRVSALEERSKAIIDDYQRMSGLEARTVDATEALTERLLVVNATYAGEVAGLKANGSLTADAVKNRFDIVHLALGAVFHRERLLNLGEMIETHAVFLSAPTHEKAFYDSAQWEAWQTGNKEWNILVHEWCDLAENYASGISRSVLATSDSHYQKKGTANVEQFPDAEAYIAYKVFCAVSENWKNWQFEALRRVHQVAFNGGGRIPVAGGGEMEELGGRDC